MRVDELVDKLKGFQLFDYGEEAFVKLFDKNVSMEDIEREFENTLLVNQLTDRSVEAVEMIEIEGQQGIVYKKYEGQTLLYTLEANPSKLEDVAELFADIHYELHQLEGTHLRSQREYYEEHILKCKELLEDEKKVLIDSIDDLPDGNTLCHGNYHLNNVLIGDEYHIMGFSNSYKGHPMSDVAKACIILEVPREISGTSNLVNEEITKKKILLSHRYLDIYGDVDDDILACFVKLAAVTRLNEGDAIEIPWLLNIIRE